jgi:hypothetical protein
MATAQRAMARRNTKLTMMATTTTMATGDDKDDGEGATGDGATGYEVDDDGDDATGYNDDDNDDNDDGDGATGYDDDNDGDG